MTPVAIGQQPPGVDLPPAMVVGAHRSVEEMPRLHECSPGFDPRRFAAHEEFFVSDVCRWTRSRFAVALSAERTAVFGVSAGAGVGARDRALAPGGLRCGLLRFPGVSTTGCSGVLPSSFPRAYLVADTLEPFFRENATYWAAALRDVGADVVMTGRVGPHGDGFWRGELPLMVAWAFGR